MKNAAISDCCRGASNYKQWECVVVEGRIEREDFAPMLYDTQFFVPSAVGLENLQSRFEGWPTEDHHGWHDLEQVEAVDEKPTVEITAKRIMGLIKAKPAGPLRGPAGSLQNVK